MLPRLGHATLWNRVAKRLVVCCGFIFLSFFAILEFGRIVPLKANETLARSPQVQALAAGIQPRAAANYGKLPLRFEANQGQTDPRVRYLARAGGYTIFLTDDEAVLSVRKSLPGGSGLGRFALPDRPGRFGHFDPRTGRWPGLADGIQSAWQSLMPDLVQMNPEANPGDGLGPARRESGPPKSVRMRLVGGKIRGVVAGFDELPGRSNYFIGNDPTKWRTNVPSFARVKYSGVYPGVDLIYYGNQAGQLEYDFRVAPGADPNQIKLSFAGADGMRVDAASGDLVLTVANDEVRLHKPAIYQPAVAAFSDRRNQSSMNLISGSDLSEHGQRSETAATAELNGEFVLASNNQVSFRMAGYDPRRTLVIDPVLSYSTYLGGTCADYAMGITVDSTGSAYVVGYSCSDDFPETNSFQATNLIGYSAFVTKLNPGGLRPGIFYFTRRHPGG